MFLILDVAVSEFSFDPVWQLYSLVFQVQQLFYFEEEAALLALSPPFRSCHLFQLENNTADKVHKSCKIIVWLKLFSPCRND